MQELKKKKHRWTIFIITIENKARSSFMMARICFKKKMRQQPWKSKF